MASAVALVVTHPRILRRLRISSCRIWMSVRPGGSLRPRISLIHQHIFRRRRTTPTRCQDIRSENHKHSSTMLLPLPHHSARYLAALHMMICGTRQLRVRSVRPPYALCPKFNISRMYDMVSAWSPRPEDTGCSVPISTQLLRKYETAAALLRRPAVGDATTFHRRGAAVSALISIFRLNAHSPLHNGETGGISVRSSSRGSDTSTSMLTNLHLQRGARGDGPTAGVAGEEGARRPVS